MLGSNLLGSPSILAPLCELVGRDAWLGAALSGGEYMVEGRAFGGMSQLGGSPVCQQGLVTPLLWSLVTSQGFTNGVFLIP